MSHNYIIDNLITSISFDKLSMLQGIKIIHLDININEYEKWVKFYFPIWRSRFGHLHHKKLVEFFTTYKLLNPQPDDVFMDAAGGIDTYLNNINIKRGYLHDIIISHELKKSLGEKIEYIESDVGEIPLPNESIDKVSCHHSFEHFQRDSDTLFIKEIMRLLKPNGKCCIIPILISNYYVELTDEITFNMQFDTESKLVIDPSATLPGGNRCGNYASIYNLKAFQQRIINSIDSSKFKVTLTELKMEGELVPDLTLKCHKHVSAINRPYRAMLIERFQ